MAQIINCKELAQSRIADLKRCMQALPYPPGLGVVLVGDNAAAKTYAASIRRACDSIGFCSAFLPLSASSQTEDVIDAVSWLSNAPDIDGIIVLSPLPEHIDRRRVVDAIPTWADVDALNSDTIGAIMLGDAPFVPCTVDGIMEILDSILPSTHCDLNGANCVILGRSSVVGKPLAMLLTQRDATVTLCHSHTKDVKEIARRADVLISCVGRAGSVTADMVKPGAIVIDVGINRDENWNVVGDVCFGPVSEVAGFITPVPGGVGEMTIASLLWNTYRSALMSISPGMPA